MQDKSDSKRKTFPTMKLRQKYMVTFLLLLNVVAFIYLLIANSNIQQNKAVKRYTEMFFSLAQPPQGASKYFDTARIDDTGTFMPLSWKLVTNAKSVFPIYQKMFRINKQLNQYINDYLNYENMEYGIDKNIIQFKSFVPEGDLSKLDKLLREVLYTGRPVKVGVVGGIMSIDRSCTDNIFGKCMYAETFVRWLGLMTESEVELHNVAIESGNSDYYSWCLRPHLDVHDMDIILIEFAGVDYDNQNIYTRNNYIEPGRPLEEITRQILAAPNKPFPMYINFPSVREIRNKNCINSEYYAQKLLARHYDISSVSWVVPFCPKLWHPKFLMSDVIEMDGVSPTAQVHKQMALLLINNFRKRLLKMTENEIRQAQSDTVFVKKMITDLATYQAKNTGAAMVTNDTVAMVNLTNDGDLKSLRKPLFKDTWLTSPQCWPSSKPQYIQDHSLTMHGNTSWRYTEFDSRSWWETEQKNDQISFSFHVDGKANHTAIVAITRVSCVTCGQAIVWIDNDFTSSTLVQAKHPNYVYMVEEVAKNVAPGYHVITIKNMEYKLFQVTAVMVGYKEIIPV